MYSITQKEVHLLLLEFCQGFHSCIPLFAISNSLDVILLLLALANTNLKPNRLDF